MSDPLNNTYIISNNKEKSKKRVYNVNIVNKGEAKGAIDKLYKEPDVKNSNEVFENTERIKQKQRNLVSDNIIPEHIEIEDIDISFINDIKNTLNIIIDGKEVPIIPMALSLFNELNKSSDANLFKKNINPPFISYVRDPNVQKGTYFGNEISGLPFQKKYTFAKCKEIINGKEETVHYKMSQPTPVDITYTVSYICTRVRDINKLNQLILKKYKNINNYISVKERYMPVSLTDIGDSSELDISNRKFYKQDYSLLIKGFLICKDDINKCVVPSDIKLNFNVKNKQNDHECFICNIHDSSFTYCFNFKRNINNCSIISDFNGIINSSNILNSNMYNLYVNDCIKELPVNLNKGDKIFVEHFFTKKKPSCIKFYGDI